MSAEPFMNGLQPAPQTPHQVAIAHYRLKLADAAAALTTQQQQRQLVQRLVQLNQNKAFGLMPDAGLPEQTTMSPGGIHIGDMFVQHPVPMLSAPQPAPQPAGTLAKWAVGAAAAVAGLGAGLGLPHLLQPEPPAVVEPAPVVETPIDTDTIGILEPDRD